MSEVRLTAAEREALDEPWMTDDFGALTAAVESIIAARLAAVEALADEWDRHPYALISGTPIARLRAALTAAPGGEDRQAGRALRGPGSGSDGTGVSE